MKISLLVETESWIIAIILFMLMISSTMLGVKIGSAKRKRTLAAGMPGKTADTNYLTGLFFFLLAFTFGMSGSRYDARRKVIVEEANIIGTAILRADLYSPEERFNFRRDFSEYVEDRIAYFEAGTDVGKIISSQKKSQEASQRLWARAMKLSTDPKYIHATLLMTPSLNEMIDINTTRFAGEKAKVPESIVWMLFALACINSFFSGYTGTMKGTLDWLVEIGFCLLISLVILFTLDIDRPRRGFVTLDATTQTIVDLRSNFK
jgi:hypothetical protein